MGRQKSNVQQQISRPKRKATNAHIFRYLQTRNPSKLEENDLKRALEASLEECPDFWPEESNSTSSSTRSNNSNTKRFPQANLTANSNCCPNIVHKRYKPVAKKNIYEADFFHDGIMEYIEYALELSWSKNEH